MRRISISSKPLSLLAGLTLMAAAVVTTPARAAEMPAKDMPAKEMPAGSGATFINSGNHHITLYTRFGGSGDCGAQPKGQTVDLDPKQTVSVDSGGSDVCVCTRVPDGRVCSAGWSTVKAGGTKHLM
jgi:hypothetical protein